MTINAPDAPTLPSLNDPANFNTRALALFSWLVTEYIPWLETLAGVTEDGEINGTPIGQAAPAAGKFTTLQADSLSGAAVQSSATDTTAGKLMRADYGYSPGNLLGTVSQSGGVPTGAVIERGGNSNGDYVRFADGTQICYRFSVAVDSTSGTTIALPATFATAAISVNVTPIQTLPIIAVTSDRSTTSFKLYAFNADGTPVATLGCAMVVIGRWY